MSTDHRPLFDAYPSLAELPHRPFAALPTPVQRNAFLSDRGGAEVWVKRDGLSHDLYGGNKVRKLEFLLAGALKRGSKRVVTTGAIGSNHALATALFAREFGLACRLVLFNQPVTEHVRMSLRLFHYAGAELELAPSYPQLVWRMGRYEAMARLPMVGQRLTVIPGGGSSPLGALGYVNAAFELAEQVRDGLCPIPKAIYVPAGTCGTLAGLIVGFRLMDWPTQVIGVRVVPSFLANPTAIAQLANKTAALMQAFGHDVDWQRLDAAAVTLLDGYIGDGYGDVTTASAEAVELGQKAGLRLETTYTGKTVAALLDAVRDGRHGTEPVLYWNTYNEQNLSPLAERVPVDALPSAFHRYFEDAS